MNEQGNELVAFDKEAEFRLLGILWDRDSNVFRISYNSDQSSAVATERIILSEISKLFDPLGFLRSGYCNREVDFARIVAVGCGLGRVHSSRHTQSMAAVKGAIIRFEFSTNSPLRRASRGYKIRANSRF